ncbi:hypothetical protein J7M00_04780, partial [bacterium]|nr:hypothetical protein [bacterium]
MAFTWTKPLGVGVIIQLDTLQEIRDNIDIVDNTKCNPHNSTVYSSEKSTDNGTYNGSIYSTVNSSEKS